MKHHSLFYYYLCILTAGFFILLLTGCADRHAFRILQQINEGEMPLSGINIEYPFNNTMFPPEIPSPHFKWTGIKTIKTGWNVFITSKDGKILLSDQVERSAWGPDSIMWLNFKKNYQDSICFFTVISKTKNKYTSKIPCARISFSISKDSVGADIFFRAVTLPFGFAVRNVHTIEWYLGSVQGGKPKKMLDNMPVCANCHSFNANGSFLAMDVDYGNDKGSYAISSTHDTCLLKPDNIITWSDYKREEGDPTFGLLSQISPDGRYVLSTIKDLSVFVEVNNNLAYSQLFFPIKGIIGIYNREKKSFDELQGANERKLVQSNPSWSPDGKRIIFARTNAYISERVKKSGRALLSTDDIAEFFSGGKQFKFDLYSINFNEGKGAKPVPVNGASANGKSNYFAKFSPDGKWIVFCMANNFMLLQPDSKLYIMPAEGGEPRLMNCNLDSMNSWHSWSPNSKWLVFSSKHGGLYTQLYLTHIDDNGNDSPPVLLENLLFDKRAANIPEFFPGKSNDFKKIKDDFSKTAPSYAALATDNVLNKYYKRAWDNLEMAIQIDSNYLEAYISRISLSSKLFQSNSKIDRHDKRKALELTNALLEKNKNDLHLQMLHATIMVASGNDAEALKEALVLLNQYPNNYRIYEFITAEYRKTKQYEKAIPYYKKMMTLSPANIGQLKNLTAGAYIGMGKSEKALQILNQLIAEHPYDYDLYATRIGIYIDNKDFARAETDCKKIILADSSNYKYYQLRASLFLKSGDRQKALSDYQKSIELINIEYTKNQEDISLLFDRAEQNILLGNNALANEDYDKILTSFPGNYQALKEKARILLSEKNWQDMITVYDQLDQNYPPEEEFFNNQAIAYLNIGDYKQALEKLNRTIVLNPVNCDALYNRARLLKMLGKNNEAESDLKKAINILEEKRKQGKIKSEELEWLNSLKKEF